MRLFVALLPPPDPVRELSAALSAVRRLGDAAALRWTEPAGWHFTLAFLGEVPDAVRPELHRRLGGAAAADRPHELRLAGAGRFGGRALWVGADGDLPGLVRLAESVRAAARAAGAAADETYGFAPHLTVARTSGVPRERARDRSRTAPGGSRTGPRPGADLRPFVAALDGFRGAPWTAADLSLVSSVPADPAGPDTPADAPRYTALAHWPLGRPGGPAETGTHPAG
ncbi:RNA 2',3'-cyclic phosphodiesterase [Streptomyces sp. NBC_01190]|uniref:RNA 2',3'-cyclic phosphodiesterase n=1 Tax=Streptomyces sp. NBC_01190 TaxID=2903767 RepID=UPI00386D2030|nr:RNA 2',3'-cyclic phosphodiesterase [Streptomyces sp. NBC_01190]